MILFVKNNVVGVPTVLCRKKSERILLKTAFSKFTNEESNQLLIDIEDEDNEGNKLVQPQIRRERQKKCSTPKKKTKKQTGGDDDYMKFKMLNINWNL
uniref:Uncharacterized protein n=1 Tax=Lactuca sativa TaxID=4236 RepID=A0A9R1VIK8_LACSA|nr:hypothetical protein LSAT_V11C500257050 [Lactuca sativa]